MELAIDLYGYLVYKIFLLASTYLKRNFWPKYVRIGKWLFVTYETTRLSTQEVYLRISLLTKGYYIRKIYPASFRCYLCDKKVYSSSFVICGVDMCNKCFRKIRNVNDFTMIRHNAGCRLISNVIPRYENIFTIKPLGFYEFDFPMSTCRFGALSIDRIFSDVNIDLRRTLAFCIVCNRYIPEVHPLSNRAICLQCQPWVNELITMRYFRSFMYLRTLPFLAELVIEIANHLISQFSI